MVEVLSIGEVERWVLFAWILLTGLLNLTGNTTIIYALSSGRINQDDVTVFIMKNIAFSDLIFGVTVGVPVFLTLAADGWILGDEVCKVTAILLVPLFIPTVTLVLCLGVNKLIILIKPFIARTRPVTRTKVYILVGCWGPALLILALRIIFSKEGRYSVKFFACIVDGFGTGWKIHSILVRCFLLPSILGVVFSILALLFIAQRQTRLALNRSGTWATLMVAGIYLILYGPALFVLSQENPHPLPQMVGAVLTLTNTCHNFFTYFLTLRSFKTYVMAKFNSVMTWAQRDERREKEEAGRSVAKDQKNVDRESGEIGEGADARVGGEVREVGDPCENQELKDLL